MKKGKFFQIIFLLLAVFLNSCIFFNSKVYFTINKKSTNQDYLKYNENVRNHYDSLSKFTKITNDAFDDTYLESHITIIFDTLNTFNDKNIVDIGAITGKSHEKNCDWLLYKMKKKSILKGANKIVIHKLIKYNNSGSLLRILLKKNDQDSPPIKRIIYSGKIIYVK